MEDAGCGAPGNSVADKTLVPILWQRSLNLTGAFHAGNGWVAGGCWDDCENENSYEMGHSLIPDLKHQ